MVRTRRANPAPQPPVPARRQPPQRRRQPPARQQAPARRRPGAGVPVVQQQGNQPGDNAVNGPVGNLPQPVVNAQAHQIQVTADAHKNQQADPTNGELLMQMLTKQQAQIDSISDILASKIIDKSATTSTVSATMNSSATASSSAQPTVNLGQLNVVESHNIHVEGLPLGSLLPIKVKELIWNKKFVEMALILKPESTSMIVNFARDMDGNDSMNLTPRVHKQLPEAEWIKAFNIFVSVYVEKFPLELNALLTYAQKVQAIMAKGGDWHNFDRTYRKELAVTQKSYFTLRPDLEIVAYTNVIAPPKPVKASKRFHPYHDNSNAAAASSSNHIPNGKCFRFHTFGKFCKNSADDCGYDHSCDLCGNEKIHPRYNCGKASATNTSKTG